MGEPLIQQLAFYFSDANLRKDKFLLRITGPKGTGAVDVATLLTFNRVKRLKADHDAAVEALRELPELEVSADGKRVSRLRQLSAEDDDTDVRTVYVEALPAGCSREALQAAFGGFGKVVYVGLPRLPSGDIKGFAFVEFSSVDAARAAVAAAGSIRVGEGGGGEGEGGEGGNVRVLHRPTWDAMQREYKAALEAGRAEAEAAEAAAAAEAEKERIEAEEATTRSVVKVTGVPRGVSVKGVRKEMREAFGAVGPVEYVDFGVSNSGDATTAFVRMQTAVAASEAVRILAERGVEFGGKAVELGLMRGEALREYLKKIGALRRQKAAVSKGKRDKWWAKKYGDKKGGDGKEGAEGAGGAAGDGEAGAADGEGGDAAKRPREDDGSSSPLSQEGDEGDAKRARV